MYQQFEFKISEFEYLLKLKLTKKNLYMLLAPKNGANYKKSIKIY